MNVSINMRVVAQSFFQIVKRLWRLVNNDCRPGQSIHFLRCPRRKLPWRRRESGGGRGGREAVGEVIIGNVEKSTNCANQEPPLGESIIAPQSNLIMEILRPAKTE